MDDANQAGETPVPSDPPAPESPEPAAALTPESDLGATLPARSPVPRGLLVWLVALIGLGVGGLLIGAQELSAMIAFAGIFIAAQAADVDPRWFAPYLVLAPVLPVGGAAAFTLLAMDILNGDAPDPLRYVGTAFAIVAGVLSLLTLHPTIVRALTRALFRSSDDSHVLHLSARAVALTLLMVFPGVLVLPHALEVVLERPGGIFESGSLGAELVGYVVLALASVGFLVRRDLRGTLDRLGVRAPRARDLVLVAAGAGALFVLNSGAEWIQQHLCPGAWAHDRRVNEELVRGVTAPVAMLLGATAGIGEEITVRGALQPRLGLVLTSIVFAALHVQYSWYGMLAIFLIGLVLGTLRQRAGTTVAMAVHALYDVLAVFTT